MTICRFVSCSGRTRILKGTQTWVLAVIAIATFAGCALPGKTENSTETPPTRLEELFASDPSAEEAPEPDTPQVRNPPAKTIRFEGRETVLGTADVAPVPTGTFIADLQALLAQEKYFTASQLISAHPDVAEQAFWERYANASDDSLVSFIAETLSKDVPPAISLQTLRETLQSKPVAGQTYHQSRSRFATRLKSENPSQQDAEQLRIQAQSLDHPLVMLDALRLLALRELVNGRHAWAESLFLQAAKIAEQHRDRVRESELWLMVATTANRSERFKDASSAWRKATQTRIELHLESDRTLHPGFWVRADEQRPTGTSWPKETSRALATHAAPVGGTVSALSAPERILWSAVAVSQYEASEHQAALLNFKKAETFADGEDAMWLRIAQSKCLAGLGQSHAAAALLSGPAASDNPKIAIASTAAIGSAKLQAGTYQQGLQLLNKALEDSRANDWPGRNRAEADLALGLLILGETDPGLESLHAVQNEFERQGERLSLLQALENELRLLEHENRDAESARVQDRIKQLERSDRSPSMGGGFPIAARPSEPSAMPLPRRLQR